MTELNVLIVDDDPVALYMHERTIIKSKISNDPAAFPGGREALDYLVKCDSPAKTFIVFLDINMPLMSGWEFMDSIARHPFSARVYFLIATSSVHRTDRERIKRYPQVIGFLEKPFNEDDLKETMAEVLGRMSG